MNKPNMDIRAFIFSAGLKQWEVAQRLGVSESAFVRILRKQLSAEEKSLIKAAVCAGGVDDAPKWKERYYGSQD